MDNKKSTGDSKSCATRQATLLINAGAPMESVQKMLGHESPETTMAVYAHLRQETVEPDIETFRAPVRGRAGN
jgi:integrase